MDKELLFKSRLGEADVELPGLGVVRVRGLTREEMLHAPKAEDEPLLMERYMLATALVDPVLTQDEVARWQSVSPADEMTPLVHKINELSGIGKPAEKAAYEAFRSQSGS